MAIKEQVQTARDTAQRKASEAKERMQSAATRVRDTAEKGVSALKAEGGAAIDYQKHRLADRIAQSSEALHRAADKLHQESDDAFAHYADQVGKFLDRGADYLRTKDWEQLRQDTEYLVRRNQPLVFGGMFLLGFAVVRFLKAVPTEHASEAQQADWPEGTGGWSEDDTAVPEVGVGSTTWPGYTRPEAGTPSGTPS